MPERKLALEVVERLGEVGSHTTWRWCELVTHPAASAVRDQYVSATALGIATYLSPRGLDAFPSFRTLADRLCLSRRVVSRSAWALEAGGWLDDVGTGPRGTVRWCASVPVALYRVMENGHHGDGLPWGELLDDDRVQAAVVDALRPVAAYVADTRDADPDPTPPDGPTCGAPTASGGACARPSQHGYCAQHEGRTAAEWVAHHRRRQARRAEYLDAPVGHAAGTTDGPVAPATGTIDTPDDDLDDDQTPVGHAAGTSRATSDRPVAPAAGRGVVPAAGARSTRDPTYGYYEDGSHTRTHAREDSNPPGWQPCIHCGKPTRLRTPDDEPVHVHCIPIEARP